MHERPENTEVGQIDGVTVVCEVCPRAAPWQRTGSLLISATGKIIFEVPEDTGLTHDCRRHHWETGDESGKFGHNRFSVFFKGKLVGSLSVSSSCAVGGFKDKAFEDLIQPSLTRITIY